MTTNRESTSNSIQFAPLRMADLMPNLLALNKSPDSPDLSNYSDIDSDSSPEETTTHKNTISKVCTPKKACSEDRNIFLKTFSTNNKENKPPMTQDKIVTGKKLPLLPSCLNSNDSSFSHDKNNSISLLGIKDDTHPDRKYNPHPKADTNPQTTKLTVIPQVSNLRTVESAKKVETLKNTPKSIKKVKNVTPNYKIKRFTPSSGRSARRSVKKTPQKVSAPSNKESIRCLFPEAPPDKEQEQHSQGMVIPTPSHPQSQGITLQTPLQQHRRPPVPCATPSYPQTTTGQSKITLKTTTIKGKNYMFIRKIGTGGSSEVFKVLDVGGSGEYAMKSVNLAVDRGLAQGYVNEIRLLRELQFSDRVIRLYDYEYDRTNQQLRVLLEVGETDLSSFLKARGTPGLPPALVLYYWQEMLHAVSHIHQHGVIHADLKPANFLLVCGRLKLIDFGIASAISAEATSVVRPCAAGTFSYISPEALMGGAGGYGSLGRKDGDAPIKICFQSDVWSLGCILYSMVYGRTPFGHITHAMVKITAIVDPNHRIDYPPTTNLPPALIKAMRWCLTYNAKARPSVAELLAIPYHEAPQAPLPQPLLDKLYQHVTPEEYELLKKAQVKV